MNLKLKHYLELDGVRAIAVLMVMLYHFFQDLNTSDAVLLFVKKISLFGKTGVSLFFVLSGFLITRILIDTKQREGYFKSFYARRILRIFPLYYFFLIVYYFILPLLPGRSFVGFSDQIWYWAFLQNVAMTFGWHNIGPSHYWSLAVEEHFYFFWPLIIYFCSLKNIKWAIVALCVLSLGTRFLLIYFHFEESQFSLARFDELAIGACLAMLEREHQLTRNNLKYFASAFIILLFPLLYISLKNGSYSLLDSMMRYLILGLFYGSFIAVAMTLNTKHFLKKILSNNLMRFTGKISFGLYVYHPICFLLVSKYLKVPNLALHFVLCIGLAYLVSVLSYYLLEKRFLGLKSKFGY